MSEENKVPKIKMLSENEGKRRIVTITSKNYNNLRNFSVRNNKKMVDTVDMLFNNIMHTNNMHCFMEYLIDTYEINTVNDIEVDKRLSTTKGITISGPDFYRITLEHARCKNRHRQDAQIAINSIISYAFDNVGSWYYELKKSKQDTCCVNINISIRRDLLSLSDQTNKTICDIVSDMIDSSTNNFYISNVCEAGQCETILIRKASYNKLEQLSKSQGYDIDTYVNSFLCFALIRMLVVK